MPYSRRPAIGSSDMVWGDLTDRIQASTSCRFELASKNRQPLRVPATRAIQASCSERSQRLFFGEVMPESDRSPPRK